MINEKFFKLVNEDIDGVISPRHKKILEEQIQNDAEAAKLYREMKEVSLSLNKLPDVEPSDNLRKTILNSLDLSKYSAKKDKKRAFLSIPALKPSLVFSFSLGLAAGLLIFITLLQNPSLRDNSEDQLISGTMGVTNAQVIKTIPVNIREINGNIVILKGREQNSESDHFEMKIYMKAQQQTDLEFNFESADPEIENFISSGNVSIARERGKIKVSSVGQQNSAVIFSFNSTLPELLTVKIFSSGDELFWQKVSLRD